MGEQKFNKNKNVSELVFSISDKPLDLLSRVLIKLQAALQEAEEDLATSENLLADKIMANKVAHDLGYGPEDLSPLQTMIEKIKKSIIITRDLIKQYEIQMEALKKGDRHLEQAFGKQPGEKNRPSA